MSAFWKGVLAVLTFAVVVSLVTLFSGSRPVGSENLIGRALPEFAAPLTIGGLDGDANVYTKAQAEAVDATAACDVDLEGSFNSCRDLPGDAIVVFWNVSKPECVEQVDQLQSFANSNEGVSVVAVAFENTKAEVAEVVVREGWTIPVAVDRDGALASLYAVAGCPSVFWTRDQKTTAVKLGVQTEQQLADGFGPTSESSK